MQDPQYKRLFIDMDSFYSSIEQMDNPELQGKPVIVVPCLTDYTCAIAASYEAKALGIKTGTSVIEAKQKAFDLIVLEARPARYIEVHNKLVKILYEHFDNVHILSIDEMACELPDGIEDWGCDFIVDLLKMDIKRKLGSNITCGIGIAPNVFLAKVAAEIEKPNGYVLLPSYKVKETLSNLELTDLPGIKHKLAKRLAKVGIRSVSDLLKADMLKMKRGWQSIVGIKWHYMLRGSLEYDYGKKISDIPRSIGHSHVLPPENRSRQGARLVFDALLSKAIDRLQKNTLVAGSLQIYMTIKNVETGRNRFSVKQSGKVSYSNSSGYWIGLANKLWDEINIQWEEVPTSISINFGRTELANNVTMSLFEFEYEDIKLSEEYKIPDRISFGDPGKIYKEVDEFEDH